MVAPSRLCDFGRLGSLFSNQLPEDHRKEIEAHLLTCPICRDRLDELAGGARWWSDVRRFLGGDGLTESACAAGQPTRTGPASGGLDFLHPSEDPSSLGRLGIYEVHGVVGRGGMGMVLKAFDPSLHRPVAIKVLAAEYAANGTARKRFAREAQATAAVVHDHVVPVYAVDAGVTPPYLVMAFIAGRSLQQRIDQGGPLELKEVLRIGMQTASGLAAAHAQGLVHRDIKPANIMLENGVERVRITDFGLARAVDDASVTRSGAVAGTPQYMAPEQARAETVDQRADLFALGSTLYAMCTGRAPFRGDTGMAVLRQVSDAEPEPVRAINPDVPAWLEGIIRKLHAKNPARRFQSAAEVADLLERCLAHVQQPGLFHLPRPAAELGRQLSGGRRHTASPRRLAFATLAVAALALSTMLWLVRPTGDDGSTALPPGPPAGASAAAAEAALAPSFNADFAARTGELRGSLAGLHGAFSTDLPVRENGPVPPLSSLRQRAAQLERQLHESAAPAPDPIETQMDLVRQRLELLRKQLGHNGP